jgi:acetylornithine deacetylase/succinyl-diaminopimelate desuccinylase-like protein
VATVQTDWIDELSELLRIPSVSADSGHKDDVRRAAEWVCAFVREAGGEAEVVMQGDSPLAIGEVPVSRSGPAPTVLVYGHFDVQPPAPLELWESPPFEPTIRDGQLFARGVADDKGNLYMILKAVQELAATGSLPVNVRIACDGEEEIGGHSIVDFLDADLRRADACLIYDGTMVAPGRPAFNVATRGLVYFHLRVRTGESDMHSGLYGGAALNALHVLIRMLAPLLAKDGRLPEALRAGIAAPTKEELEGWAALPPGAGELANAGGRPLDDRAAEEFYTRTFAEPSLDVNGIAGGSPQLVKTVLPVEAEANVSIRLAPGQDVDEIRETFEGLLRENVPAGAELEIELASASPPGLADPRSAPLQLALDAVEKAVGARPLLTRSGGTLPIIAALAEKGIPTVLTAFNLPDCGAHAPNERLPLEYLPLGAAAAREILTAWARL